MRPTKCGQDRAKRTLRSRARAKNEGIFGVFECDIGCDQAIDYPQSPLQISSISVADGNLKIKSKLKFFP